jgi:GH24 family phage-related lysozyme (muramidase)
MIIQSFLQFIKESNDFKRILKHGDYGDDVKALQRGLEIKNPDGDFGDDTKKLLISYQKKRGLEPTGTFGRETWSVMFPEKKVNIQDILNRLERASSGLGTDEEALKNAILNIPSREVVVSINNLISKNPDKYSYQNIGDYFSGELGIFDSGVRDRIEKHLAKIGALGLVKSTKLPPINDGTIVKATLDSVVKHEDVKLEVYPDPIHGWKVPTIGIGFNLARKDADKKLKALGLNPVLIRKKKSKITKEQAYKLATDDIYNALQGAKRLIKNFNEHPLEVRSAITEVIFNIGVTGFSKFDNFIDLIHKKNYKRAAKELMNSSWSRQVGRRAEEISDKIYSAKLTS